MNKHRLQLLLADRGFHYSCFTIPSKLPPPLEGKTLRMRSFTVDGMPCFHPYGEGMTLQEFTVFWDSLEEEFCRLLASPHLVDNKWAMVPTSQGALLGRFELLASLMSRSFLFFVPDIGTTLVKIPTVEIQRYVMEAAELAAP